MKIKKPTMHLKLVTSFFYCLFLINTNCYVTLMPLEALEVCELHLYDAACSTEHDNAAVHGNRSRVCWVRIYGNPQPTTPPTHPTKKCPNTQEVSDSMARLCSFLLDCVEMKTKNGSSLKRNAETESQGRWRCKRHPLQFIETSECLTSTWSAPTCKPHVRHGRMR